MDYQNDIEWIKNYSMHDCKRCGYKDTENCDTGFCCCDNAALGNAISAMQELQALHEQGFSIERLKDIDFRKEVIEHINYMEYMSVKGELEDYQQLGTLDEVRAAVEKQKPIAPTYEGDGYAPDGTFVWDEWICPCCGKKYEVEFEEHAYCPECGQSIDWSEEE